MGGVAIAIASTAAESAGAGAHALEDALRGVLIAAGVLALAMSALLVALGRHRRVPATVIAAASPQACASVQSFEHRAEAGEAGQVVP